MKHEQIFKKMQGTINALKYVQYEYQKKKKKREDREEAKNNLKNND